MLHTDLSHLQHLKLYQVYTEMKKSESQNQVGHLVSRSINPRLIISLLIIFLSACYTPYVAIADRCLFVDEHTAGTWYEMQEFCSKMNGRLLKLDDANLLNDIVEYIFYQGQFSCLWKVCNDIDLI